MSDNNDTASEKEYFEGLGQRIAGLRDACGFSAEEFADKLGLDHETYLAYERTGEDVPASLLYHIVQICGIDMGTLLRGTGSHLNTYQVVKAGHGKEVDRLPGYHFEDLAYNYKGNVMQPLLVTLDPSDEVAELVTHDGQEFNYVTAGSMALVFGDREVVLETGDSVYFDPRMPHGQRCVGDAPATFVTVIME